MPGIRVWSKQNIAVLDQLDKNGRFIADEFYIRKELEDTADIMLNIYEWLSSHSPNASSRPDDVKYPVWVSLEREATMIPEEGYVVLELEIDADDIALLDTAKWTCITNYSYIPEYKEDRERHADYMKSLGISDARAVMTQFYPEAKNEIIASWDRLFDENVRLGSETVYGIIWEVREEWIEKIIK